MAHARRIPRSCMVTLAAVLVSGCSSTQLISQVNPEAAHRDLHRVMVHANIHDLAHRHLAERKICARMIRLTSCECLPSHKVFFPGEQFSAERIASRLADLGVDGVLTLQPAGSGMTSVYLPSTSHT